MEYLPGVHCRRSERVSRRIGRLGAVMGLVFGLAAIWIAVPVCAPAQVPGSKSAKASGEKETTPAVKIEVKKKEGENGAGVEVIVEGAESKDRAASKKPAAAKIVDKTREERVKARFDLVYETAQAKT